MAVGIHNSQKETGNLTTCTNGFQIFTAN